jgi:hypothetical protein
LILTETLKTIELRIRWRKNGKRIQEADAQEKLNASTLQVLAVFENIRLHY